MATCTCIRLAATSHAVSVKASASPATVKIAFDKATYAPFEKAVHHCTPRWTHQVSTRFLKTHSQICLLTGGITTTQAFGSQAILLQRYP
jgi:hypothetical protein